MLAFIFVVLASIFVHLRAIADLLGESARIRELLRPDARFNCVSILDGRISFPFVILRSRFFRGIFVLFLETLTIRFPVRCGLHFRR